MGYLMADGAQLNGRRFTYLGLLYDRWTRDNLTATGLSVAWRCLDVGAGDGSIAEWIANRAWNGQTIATDIDISHLRTRYATTLKHDITTDPLPGDFHLIHARLVLMHLPQRDRVLATLVAGLRPDGWLCVEELDPIFAYQPDPVTPIDHLINRVGRAFTAALQRAGADNRRGRQAHRILAAAGLEAVHNEGHVVVAVGGSTAAKLMQVNIMQTADRLLADSPLTPADIDTYVTAMEDPEVTFYMPVFFTARGRKPGDVHHR